MLDEPAPTDVDATGEWYAFERGATKTTGGEGWADVWKRDHFGWEYKGKRKDLNAAFAQLQQYALALENPPLLVVCDMDRFRIHTNWTNSVSEVYEFTLDDLRDPNVRQRLKWVFSDPERLKPGKTRQTLTEEAAAEFATLAQNYAIVGTTLPLLLISSIGWSSACLQKTLICFQKKCFCECWRRRRPIHRSFSAMPQPFSPR